MATDKQIAANRANAKKSTGPKSVAGKQKVAQNARRHGLFAKDSAVNIPVGYRAEIKPRLKALAHEFQPQNRAEFRILRNMAIADAYQMQAVELQNRAITEEMIRQAEQTPELLQDDYALRCHFAMRDLLDRSPYMELLHRQENCCMREYIRGMKTYFKLQKSRAGSQEQSQSKPARTITSAAKLTFANLSQFAHLFVTPPPPVSATPGSVSVPLPSAPSSTRRRKLGVFSKDWVRPSHLAVSRRTPCEIANPAQKRPAQENAPCLIQDTKPFIARNQDASSTKETRSQLNESEIRIKANQQSFEEIASPVPSTKAFAATANSTLELANTKQSHFKTARNTEETRSHRRTKRNQSTIQIKANKQSSENIASPVPSTKALTATADSTHEFANSKQSHFETACNTEETRSHRRTKRNQSKIQIKANSLPCAPKHSQALVRRQSALYSKSADCWSVAPLRTSHPFLSKIGACRYLGEPNPGRKNLGFETWNKVMIRAQYKICPRCVTNQTASLLQRKLARFLAFASILTVYSQTATPPDKWSAKSETFVVKNFRFKTGEVLPELKLHYLTLGQPHRDAAGHTDNAILLLHGTGGDAHSLLNPVFADELFGPGQLLDIQKHFIILPDDIGHGQSSKPADGLRMSFPHYDYDDMVAAQHTMLVDGLHVDHLRLILGTSMGCMQSFVWGETYPAFEDALAPFACLPVEIAGRNRMWRYMAMQIIRDDPEWKNGNYTTEPVEGLRAAYDLFLLAGIAPLPFQERFPTRVSAEAYVDKTLHAAVARTDANDLLYYTDASRNYNPEPHLSTISAPVLWINSADDFINPPELGIAEKLVTRMPRAKFILIPISDRTFGHGTHTHAAVWKSYLAEFLKQTEHQ